MAKKKRKSGDGEPVTENSPGSDEGIGGEDGKPRIKTLTFFGRLRAYFLAGVLVTAPLAITVALATWLIKRHEVRTLGCPGSA